MTPEDRSILLQHKAAELACKQQRWPLPLLTSLAENAGRPRPLPELLTGGPPALILSCEAEGDEAIVSGLHAYTRAGACALVVSSREVMAALRETTLASIRRDLIIDPYQIIETRAYGGDSFIVQAGLHDRASLQYFLEIGRDWGMEALIEVDTQEDYELALSTDGQCLLLNDVELGKAARGRLMIASLAKPTAAARHFCASRGYQALIEPYRLTPSNPTS